MVGIQKKIDVVGEFWENSIISGPKNKVQPKSFKMMVRIYNPSEILKALPFDLHNPTRVLPGSHISESNTA